MEQKGRQEKRIYQTGWAEGSAGLFLIFFAEKAYQVPGIRYGLLLVYYEYCQIPSDLHVPPSVYVLLLLTPAAVTSAKTCSSVMPGKHTHLRHIIDSHS